MGLVKLATASQLVQDPKDSRLLPMTERQNPQPARIKPNKTVLNWGMKK